MASIYCIMPYQSDYDGLCPSFRLANTRFFTIFLEKVAGKSSWVSLTKISWLMSRSPLSSILFVCVCGYKYIYGYIDNGKVSVL